MKTATAAKMAAQFDEFLDVSQEQPVLVTRNGKPVAMLIAVEDREEAEQLASGRPRTLRSVLVESQKQIEKEGAIPHDQFWRDLEKTRKAKRSPLRPRRK